MGKAFDEDTKQLATDTLIPWDYYLGKTVVITGSTGLIGKLIARTIHERNESHGAEISLVLLVRDPDRARASVGIPYASYTAWDASIGTIPELRQCDTIIHLAGVTTSRKMVEDPVCTIDSTLNGTRAMLELAKMHQARMVFSSSMEVYGKGSEMPIDESFGGELDSMVVRSCYPQSKRMAETLIAAYHSQYGVKACCARLAQTIGAGVPKTDTRAIASFARSCLAGEDIQLLTDGSKANTLLSTYDAATALLLLAARGEGGHAYNVGNEEAFTSVWTIANVIATHFGHGSKVSRATDNEQASQFAAGGKIRLDCSKLSALGWKPRYGLVAMLGRLIEDWE